MTEKPNKPRRRIKRLPSDLTRIAVFKTRNLLLTTEQTGQEITKELMEEYGVSYGVARSTLLKAREMLSRDLEDEGKIVFKGIRNELFFILDRLRESGNYVAMLTALKLMSSIYGFENQSVNLKIKDAGKLKDIETQTLLKVISENEQN